MNLVEDLFEIALWVIDNNQKSVFLMYLIAENITQNCSLQNICDM